MSKLKNSDEVAQPPHFPVLHPASTPHPRPTAAQCTLSGKLELAEQINGNFRECQKSEPLVLFFFEFMACGMKRRHTIFKHFHTYAYPLNVASVYKCLNYHDSDQHIVQILIFMSIERICDMG